MSYAVETSNSCQSSQEIGFSLPFELRGFLGTADGEPVFLASDRRLPATLGRLEVLVALRLIQLETTSVSSEQVERESKLSNNHLVKVFEWIQHGEQCAVSTELIRGFSLNEWTLCHQITESHVLGIVLQILHGAHYLLQQGYEPRVSADTLFVTDEGIVKFAPLVHPYVGPGWHSSVQRSFIRHLHELVYALWGVDIAVARPNLLSKLTQRLGFGRPRISSAFIIELCSLIEEGYVKMKNESGYSCISLAEHLRAALDPSKDLITHRNGLAAAQTVVVPEPEYPGSRFTLVTVSYFILILTLIAVFGQDLCNSLGVGRVTIQEIRREAGKKTEFSAHTQQGALKARTNRSN